MSEKQKIKVIKIIDDKSLVINAGADKGLHVGDIIEVFQPGDEVVDPETNESLGSLDYVKARLDVVTSLPKMSVCKDKKSRNAFFDPLTTTFINQTYYESISIDPKDISGGYENVDKVIRVGDLVRKVHE